MGQQVSGDFLSDLAATGSAPPPPPAASSGDFLGDLATAHQQVAATTAPPQQTGPQAAPSAAHQDFLDQLMDARGWGRALGLTGRNIIEGAAFLPTLAGDTIASGVNALGGNMAYPSQTLASDLDAAGLPRPQTALEKVGSVVEQGLTGGGVQAPMERLALGTMQSAPAAFVASAPSASPRAASSLASALAEDNVDPAALRARLAAAREVGQPLALADVVPKGGNAQALARAVVTQPGQGRQIATAALNDRAGPAAQERIGTLASTMAGNPTPQATTAAYNSVLPTELPGDDLRAALEGYAPFQGAHEALRASPGALDVPAQLFDPKTGKLLRTPTVGDVDAIKRVIQARTQALSVPGSVAPEQVPGLRGQSQMLDSLLDQVDAMSPEYKAARDLAQRNIGIRDVRQALAQRANQASPYPDFAQPVVGGSDLSANAAELARQFPGRPAQLRAFMQQMQNERDMQATRNFMLTGSPTAARTAELGMLDPENVGLAIDAGRGVTGDATSLLKLGHRAVNNVVGRVNAARNRSLASVMYDTSGDAADAFLRQLDEVEAARRAAQIQ